MKKVIFVCLGNICRSPMAEMMFDDLLQKNNLQSEFSVSSMATANYEIGNSPHPGAIAELKKHSIPLVAHQAQQITADDIAAADIVIGMDDQNIIDLKNIAPAGMSEKIKQAYDITGSSRAIKDPWYDHRFDRTFSELSEVLPLWLKDLQ